MRALLISILLVPALSFAGIAVSPVLIDQTVTEKDNTLSLVVANPNDEPLQITISTAPLAHDRMGRPVPGKVNYPYDASGLIHVDQPSFLLKARRWRRIHAHVDLPSRPGDGFAFIYVKGTPLHANEKGLVAAVQVGVVVELSFPNPGRAAVAVESLTPEKDGLRVAVRNEGQSRVAPEGTVVLHDASGREVFRSQIVPAHVFPGMVRELQLASLPKGLANGDYTAEVAVTGPVKATLDQTVAVEKGKLVVNHAVASQLSRR